MHFQYLQVTLKLRPTNETMAGIGLRAPDMCKFLIQFVDNYKYVHNDTELCKFARCIYNRKCICYLYIALPSRMYGNYC